MIKKVYHISGFDCGNCAKKTETHLSKREEIESVSLDFAQDRLYITFKENELSSEEIMKIIKEVESDELEFYPLDKKLIKKKYHISGFDCANCAKKAEAHLAKANGISACSLDFAQDSLYITYEDKEKSIEELRAIIKEVESDDIELSSVEDKKKKTTYFDKSFWILVARIVFVIAVMIVSMTALADEKYFWVNFGLYLASVVIITYDIFWKFILHVIHLENPIDEYLLISLASIGAFTIATVTKHSHDFMESTMVAMFWQIGKIIEGYATYKSKQAISGAVSLRVEHASKVVNGEVIEVSPESLEIGDEVIVTAGELIPIDGVISKGNGFVDISSLTGEFVPVEVKEKSLVYSGCVLKEGTVYIKASKEYKDSTVSRILELISNSGEKKSKADQFVTKFARWYTPIVFVVSILTGLIGGLITKDWSNWVILGLKMLVVACPCAIVISVPLAYFSSIGLASKNGIVIKGTSYLDALYEIKKIVTDKTGTLTEGVFEITKVNGEEKLLPTLVAIEKMSNHPIGKAIVESENSKNSGLLVEDFEEIAGKGVSGIIDNQIVLAGNANLLKEYNIEFSPVDEMGVVVYCSKGNKYLGYVVVSDKIREESKALVNDLSKAKIDLVMLTGDKENNAKVFANELGIKEYYSELLPDQKVTILEKQLSKKYKVGFVGDGINDAASIKLADVGFAMGGIGSDAAVENADVVIMNDKPSKIFDAIKIAKIARHTSVFNTIFAIAVKFTVEVLAVTFNLLGNPGVIPMWLAVVADTGLTVLLVINSLLILYRKIRH